ncbi:Hypothetical predicted protein [Olea europaea subsp. europaea]|uniref:Uncharacterized protein n=1 Tax=Olea europaea subsp. europaea TaxID=158383 RepID=A0A8S0VJQ6_OLEEU|nr:Hypothetical predicted protein [Olea europaea subsp. europaea]
MQQWLDAQTCVKVGLLVGVSGSRFVLVACDVSSMFVEADFVGAMWVLWCDVVQCGDVRIFSGDNVGGGSGGGDGVVQTTTMILFCVFGGGGGFGCINFVDVSVGVGVGVGVGGGDTVMVVASNGGGSGVGDDRLFDM